MEVLAVIWLAAGAASAAPVEEGLSVSAKVDKTAVDAGAPITLTLTITGDLSGATVPAPVFPDSFEVAARTQATNVSLRAGAMERSTSLVYVLIPSRPGTFQLGPFTVEQKDRKMATQPIEITVKRSPLPPTLKPDQSGRYTI
ncbi:MAG: hypothetical protein A3D28_04430 [Omnitrophica bacterium RIFCSPHIGHO2_02_FULL_63_14]|nr:MAG: hypothetical protein A3D28_04430 [Omnitrophica bacterium RIFCSPHIGHO2_02_FULL_63_14]